MKSLIYFLVLLCTSLLYSQTITLDATFGSNGIQNSLYNDGYINSSVLLPNGQVLIAGNISADNRFNVAKHNTNGSFDTSFGINGYLRYNTIPNQKEWIYAIKAQTDNKFIVAGKSDVSPSLSIYYYNTLMTRFNSNGTIDTSFGTNGYIKTELGTHQDNINNFIIRSNGDIYAVAHSYNTTLGQNVSFLIKYTSSGQPDTTFGTNGIMEIILPNSNSLNTITISADDKIVLSGSLTTGTSTNDMLIVKLNLDGSFDNTFGTNGFVTTDFGANESAVDLIVTSDNKITAIGTASASGFLPKIAVARYNTDGTLDTNFNTTGKILIINNTSGYNTSFGKKLKILPDNTYLFSGHSIGSNNYDIYLMKYNYNGTPVTSFASNGHYLLQNSTLQEFSNDVHLQPDGKVLVTGLSTGTNTTPLTFLMRFNDVFLNTIDFSLEKKFKIYPNPVEDFLNIDSEDIIQSISIYNLSGKKIIENNNSKTINTENLSSGFYTIKITTEKTIFQTKFVKK